MTQHAQARPAGPRATRVWVLILVALVGAIAAPGSGAGVFEPETFTLDNGMDVVVVTNRRVPVVTHMVWYRVGSADEPYGRSGIAHFLEHLMFKGTDQVPAGQFSRIVARNGGRDNAFTSWDFTAYYQTVARDRLDMVMAMEADRMVNLRLTDQVVGTERDVVLAERRDRVDLSPGAQLDEEMTAALFVRHPYGTPIIGWEAEISGLERADAEAFYRTWYAPNNAILVVSGDIDAAELRPLAERHYGVLAPRPLPERVRPSEPPLKTARRVVLRDPEVRQPSWVRKVTAPSYRVGERRHVYPLQVLADLLGVGDTSLLYRRLGVEQRLATNIWVDYRAGQRDLGVFAIGASPVTGVSLEQLEAAIDAELAALLEEGVSADDVETAKRRMLAEADYARDSLFGPAFALGSALVTGRTVDEVEAWPDRIAAVTVDQVTAAARAVLGVPGRVTGLLLPATTES